MTSVARAADEKSAPPTTAPVQAGSDEIKAALKAYNAAMAAEDVDGMLAHVHGTTESGQRIAKAITRTDTQVSKLLKAARDKFGADAAAKLGKAVGDVSNEDIDSGTVAIDGDQATVRHGQGGGIALIRAADGKWKINADSLGGANPDAVIQSFSATGNRAKVIAQEVAADKFKSIDEVIDRFQKASPDEGPGN
jgi:hypothetical protein